MSRILYTLFLLFVSFVSVECQTTGQEKFIQLSGIITDLTYRPLQGVAVISKKLRKGTLSESSGIYSITTAPGDTVYFRALGFKKYHTIIPEDYQEKHCMFDIRLETDTIPIASVTIMPWKNYSEFIKDVTREKPVDPIIENMNENIASIYVALSNQTVGISGATGYQYAMEQNFSAMATRYQYPVNNLLNPFAWAKFINGIKTGLFKNHTYKKPEPAKVAKKKKKVRKENNN
ncbi:MAG: carboxypeptidase-like regulatory domain-containing protein [Bacteroidales bacterium]